MDKMERRRKQGWCGQAAVRLRRDATKSEIVLRRKLCDMGLNRHRFQKFFITEKKIYIADFYIQSLKLIIEVDGGYHFTESQIKIDADKDRFYLNQRDVDKVLRLTDEQALYLSHHEIHDIIKKMKKKEVLILY